MSAAGTRLRGHWPLVAAFGLAVLMRVLYEVAYGPALFYSDSWRYLSLAFGDHHFAVDRPSGYPALLRVILEPGASLLALTTIQHLAGLATGVIAYLLLLRLGVERWLAAGAAGLILLDAYTMNLEQTLLSEPFFTLALIGSFALLIGRDRSSLALVASGLLLAGAATLRTGALLVVPFWLGYAFYRHRVRAVPALVALVAPLLLYSFVYERNTGEFGLTGANGWFLYGRVGEIADCSRFDPPAGTRVLCEPVERGQGRGGLYYIWDERSPARREFGSITEPGTNEPLEKFSMAVIRGRPGEYASLVATDFGRYFVPGEASARDIDRAIKPPKEPRTDPDWLQTEIRDAYIPGYQPEVRAPSGLVRAYSSVVHYPRPLLALAALAAIALLPMSLMRRFRPWPEGRAEALLLAGSALTIMLGAVATVGFIVRYSVAVAPLLICGGALALSLFARAARRPEEPGVSEPRPEREPRWPRRTEEAELTPTHRS